MKKLYFLSLFTAGLFTTNAQNVGIGTTNPETKLQVEGAISTSEQVSPAANSLSINSNISLFRISAVAGVQTNNISATTPAQGQLLIIINEDDNDATFAGTTITANGGSNSYVYSSSAWRMTGTSKVAPSGTGIVTVNGGVLGSPAALSGEVTTTGAGLTTTITNAAVTNTKLATMGANTLKGSITGTGAPVDLTAPQVRTMLNVADGANNYTHPTQTAIDADATNNGVNVIDRVQVNTLGHVTSVTTRDLSAATTGAAGVMSAADKTKLDGIAAGATANTGTVTSITAGTGLSGGAITTSGTISMPNIGTAGTYNYVTTDAQGRVSSGVLRTLTGTANQINIANGNFSDNPVVSLNVSVPEALRSSANMTGGGTVTWSGAFAFSWTQRFIVIANGRGSHFSTSGFFDITRPADATVITGVGGASNITVTSGAISLPVWHALYYILPIGSGSTSLAANFRVANYTANLEIPETWVLVAVRNGDNNTLRLGTGITLSPGQTWSATTSNTTGNGTLNYVSKFTGTNTLGNSQIFDNGTGVGIGTTTLGAKFTIATADLGTALNDVVEMQRLYGGNGNASYLDIRHIRTAAGSNWLSAGTRIQEKIDATWMGYVQFNGNGNNGGISFGTGNTTTAPGNVDERMRITSGGNVGIGSTDPGEKLDVVGNIRYQSIRMSDGGTPVTQQVTTTKRYHVSKRYGTNIQSSIDLDMAIIEELCGDEDGCKVRFLMKRWDNDTKTAAASREGLFFYDPATKRYRVSIGDTEGVDGDVTRTHIYNWWGCYFSDFRHVSGAAQNDNQVGLTLLTWTDSGTNANKTCEIIFED